MLAADATFAAEPPRSPIAGFQPIPPGDVQDEREVSIYFARKGEEFRKSLEDASPPVELAAAHAQLLQAVTDLASVEQELADQSIDASAASVQVYEALYELIEACKAIQSNISSRQPSYALRCAEEL